MVRFETFLYPKLIMRWDDFYAVWFHLSPPDMSIEPGRVHAPKCLLSLWGDSAGTPEEMKQFLWSRDFVQTATGVKFTLLTSQSADADQKLMSLPLQMCRAAWLCAKGRQKRSWNSFAFLTSASSDKTFWMVHLGYLIFRFPIKKSNHSVQTSSLDSNSDFGF